MKKLTKQTVLSMLIILSMLICLLGGCAAKTEAPVEASQSVESEAPVSQAPAEESAQPTEEVPETETTLISPEPVTLTYWCPLGPDMMGQINDFNDISAYQEAEKLTNVHIQWIHVSQQAESEQFNLMVSGGDYPDMARNANTAYTGGSDAAIEDGVLTDVNDYLDLAPHYSAYLDENSTFRQASFTDSGYCVGFVAYAASPALMDMGAMCRGDWLEALGLEAPTTYEEYHDVALAFKNAYDLSDAFYLPSTLTGQKSNLAGGYGTPGLFTENNERVSPSHFYVVDGTVHCSFNEDGLKDYLTMVRDWIDEGLVSRDFATRSGSVQDSANISNIVDGKTGIWYGEAQMMSDYIDMAGDGFEIVALQDAVKNEGDVTHFGPAANPYSSGHVNCIFTGADVETAVKWCDFWYSDPGAMLACWGVEGLTYELDGDGQPYYTDFVLNNPDGLTSNTAINFNVAGQIAAVTSSTSRMLAWEDYEVAASQLWTDTADNQCMIPSLTLSTEESEQFSGAYVDAWTFAVEQCLKFVMGDASIEDGWDGYVDQLETTFDIDRLIAIEQTAYDRYLTR